jgi:carbamoyl-phosphate synthase large subunit
VADAFRAGFSQEDVFDLTKIDPWFLAEIEDLITAESEYAQRNCADLSKDDWRQAKRKGFSDGRLAQLMNCAEAQVRETRQALGVKPVYRRVDTCAAEFPANSAYMYSTFEEECEARPTDRQKIMVLGGGPNRIGQGIEFDYCCVHAALAMREDGYETIMVNCNPETVSTDYDTSDRLYFEPVTLEDVLAIVEVEQPTGVIVQFGGQTPLKLADDLAKLGVPIIGTSPDAIDLAEDRERFQQLVEKLGLRQPSNRVASNAEEGVERAKEIGYPLIVRPSYVLGGRAMELVYNEDELRQYMQNAVDVSNDSPVLLDRFLDQAVEVDVDAICDGEQVVIGGIMQHIEQAGVHSGDSACSLPPYNLPMDIQNEIRDQVKRLALELNVIGLMNVQMAVQGEDVFVLEVNPRASRTVPFVSKCIGHSLAKLAARCMAGKKLADLGYTEEVVPEFVHVKESVFPFNKFIGVDPILGPEMKSTGEVMGVGETFGEAFAKASLGANERLPTGGRAFLSVKESDKPGLVNVARSLIELGFKLVATRGTARELIGQGLACEQVDKVNEGRPDVSDMLKNEQIDLIINTTEGRQSIADSAVIRRLALSNKVCYTTTLTGGEAFSIAIRQGLGDQVTSLQQLHSKLGQ